MTCKIDHDAENANPVVPMCCVRAIANTITTKENRQTPDMGGARLRSGRANPGVGTGSLRSIVVLLFAFGAFAEEP